MKRSVAVACAVLVLFASTVLLAAPKKIALPAYEEQTLDNGLKVFLMETHEVPLVSLYLLVPVGAAQDPPGMEGAANLTGRLLTKGAGGLGADEISEAIENVGGNLDVYAGLEYTIVRGSFMTEDLPLGLEYMAKIVLAPDFPAEELERERGMVIGGIRRVKEHPGSLASREFVKAMVGDHPYARPVDGSEKSVSHLTRDDITGFHGKHYRPDGSLLAVVGDIKEKKALKLVEKALGGWKKGAVEPALVAPLEMKRFPGRRILVIDKPDLTQSQIRIGNIAAPMNTPDYFPLQVANTLLGGGFTSRLVDEVRVNRGLTYHVSSRLYQRRNGGIFGIYTFTKNETLREIIDVTLGEVEKVRTVPVGREEIDKTKRYLSGLFPFDLETNDDLAWWLTRLSFLDLEDTFIEDYRVNIDGVDDEQLQTAAREYFHTDDCFMLILTNYEAVKDQLEGLGEITVVGIDEIE